MQSGRTENKVGARKERADGVGGKAVGFSTPSDLVMPFHGECAAAGTCGQD